MSLEGEENKRINNFTILNVRSIKNPLMHTEFEEKDIITF